MSDTRYISHPRSSHSLSKRSTPRVRLRRETTMLSDDQSLRAGDAQLDPLPDKLVDCPPPTGVSGLLPVHYGSPCFSNSLSLIPHRVQMPVSKSNACPCTSVSLPIAVSFDGDPTDSALSGGAVKDGAAFSFFRGSAPISVRRRGSLSQF
jgi:hypothetical protein